MAKKQNLDKYSVDFGLDGYFCANVLPEATAFMSNKSITAPTPRVQNEDNLFILVRGGTGSMAINHREIALKRGVCMCLGPFHNYCIVPDPGSTVEISQCRINSGAYLYILSCPYLRVSEFLIPREPAIARFSEKNTKKAEAIFESSRFASKSDSSYYENKASFLSFMQLFGMLLRALEDNNKPAIAKRKKKPTTSNKPQR